MAFQLAEAYVELNSRGFRTVGGAIRGIKSGMGSLVSFATGPVAVAFAGVGAAAGLITGAMKSISVAASLEQTEAQFTSLLGSTELAQQKMEELQDFSASTPFQFDGLADSAKTLLAFGTANDQIIPSLRVLGDVAAATGNDVNELANIYGKVKARGALMTESLDQFNERGIPVGRALQEMFGKTGEEIRQMASAGEISFADLQTAMQGMTQEGGVAFEGMANQAGTLTGVWSTFKDNVTVLMGDIGEALIEGFNITDIVADFTGFVQSFRSDWMPSIVAALQWAGDNLFKPIVGFVKSASEVIGDLVRNFDLYYEYTVTSLAGSMLDAYQHVKTFFENGVTIAKWWFNNAMGIFANFAANGGQIFSAMIRFQIGSWKNLLSYMATGKISSKPFLDLAKAVSLTFKGIEMPELAVAQTGQMDGDLDAISERIAARNAARDKARQKRKAENHADAMDEFQIEEKKKDETAKKEESATKKKGKTAIAVAKQVNRETEKQTAFSFSGLAQLADKMQESLTAKRDQPGTARGQFAGAGAGAAIANQGGRNMQAETQGKIQSDLLKQQVTIMQAIRDMAGGQGLRVMMAGVGGVDVPREVTQFGPRR